MLAHNLFYLGVSFHIFSPQVGFSKLHQSLPRWQLHFSRGLRNCKTDFSANSSFICHAVCIINYHITFNQFFIEIFATLLKVSSLPTSKYLFLNLSSTFIHPYRDAKYRFRRVWSTRARWRVSTTWFEAWGPNTVADDAVNKRPFAVMDGEVRATAVWPTGGIRFLSHF